MNTEEFNTAMEAYQENAKQYLEEENFHTNEHGRFIYVSTDGNHSISLTFILRDYLEYLIDHKIVKYS